MATGIPDDGERRKHVSEAFWIFNLDSLKQTKKTPSKTNQTSTGRATTPEEDEWREKEFSFSSLQCGSRGGTVSFPLYTANELPFSNLANHSFAQRQLLSQGKLRLNLCYTDIQHLMLVYA